MLIFYGAELDYQSSTGATPLHVCAFNNEVSGYEIILWMVANNPIWGNF